MTWVTEGLNELIADLDRLENDLHAEASSRLDALFYRVFGEVERAVHVQHGTLAESGEVHTYTDREGWHGEMSFEGTGIFELARGGEHYFYEPAWESESEFEATCQRILDETAG
jgi:hypothetical protein